MKTSELRNLSDDALAAQLESSHKELFNLRFRLATMQLTNHRELPKVKRTIARIKTIQHERDLAERYGAAAEV